MNQKSDQTSFYDPALALKFFQIAGTTEEFPAGKHVFVEDEKTGGFFSKSARFYLLLDGEVALTLRKKPLSLVMPGEIFGEMAVMAGMDRSATATARKNCRVMALDEKQFLQSLQKLPEFSLMLLSLMAQRLRLSIEKLSGEKADPAPEPKLKQTLDKKLVAELLHAMGDPTPTAVKAGEHVVNKGAAGAFMFVLTQGRIAISVNGVVVERLGPGGVFGEMAVLDRGDRTATATAEIDSAWFPVGRNDFIAMIKSQPAFGIALLRSMSERVQQVGKLLFK